MTEHSFPNTEQTLARDRFRPVLLILVGLALVGWGWWFFTGDITPRGGEVVTPADVLIRVMLAGAQ